MKSIQRKWLALLTAIILGVTMASSSIQQASGFQTTAYQVAFTHWDPWYEPHYGAYFQGSYGSGHWFSGPSGNYSAPHWWGSTLYAALVNKTWLFATACNTGWPSYQWITCADRSNPANHHAEMN